MLSSLYLANFVNLMLPMYSGACQAYCKKLMHDERTWYFISIGIVKFYNQFFVLELTCLVEFQLDSIKNTYSLCRLL